MRRSPTIAVALLALGASAGGLPVGPARPVEEGCLGVQVGDHPEHRFESGIVGAPGVIDLAGLRGRPLLVEFWGRRCSSCIQLAVPHALQLAADHAGELNVLFVECQSASSDEMELFAWERGWMATPAMWTAETPFRPGSRGLPSCALLSADGEVLIAGDAISLRYRIEDALADELDRVRHGPAGVSRSVRRLYADFADGHYAAALGAAQKAAAGGRDDDAARALASFQSELDQRFYRAKSLLAAGWTLEAQDLLEDLQRGLHGLPERCDPVDELLSGFVCTTMASELEAAHAFARIQEKARSKGLQGSVVKDLQRFTERYPEARCAARARHLLDLVRS